MTDVASLGFAIDSGPAVEAAGNLDKLSDSAERSSAATERMREKFEKTAQQVRSVSSGYDSLGSSARAFIAESNALRDAMQREAKSLNDVVEKRDWYADALKKAMLTQAEYIKATKELDAQEAKLRKGMGEMAGAVGGANDALGRINWTSRLVVNNYEAMARALASGDFTGFGRAVMSAATNTGALRLALGALAGTAGAVVTALGLVAVAAMNGAAEQRAFENALTAGGNMAGVTSTRLREMADAVGASTGRYGDARAALVDLAKHGQITGEALESAARAAVAIAEITGASIAQATAEVEKLGKDPVKAVVELNDKYHFLTLAVYDQIKALQEQGREEEATALAAKTAADALDQRRSGIVENMGYIGRAAKEAQGFVLDLWEAMNKLGADSTSAGQLDKLYAERGANEAAIADLYNPSILRGTHGAMRGADWRMGEAARLIERNKAIDDEIGKLREVGAQQAANDRAAAGNNAVEQNALAAGRAVDSMVLSLDKQARKQRDINELNKQFAAMWEGNTTGGNPRLANVTRDASGQFSGGLYDQLRGDIDKKYTDKSGARAASAEGRAAREAAAAMDALSNYADTLATKLGGPLDQAFAAYNQSLERSNQLAEKALIDGGTFEQVIEQQNRARQNAKQVLDETIDKIVEQADVMGRLASDTKYERSLIGVTDRQRAVTEATRQATQQFLKHKSLIEASGATLEEYAQAAGDAAGQIYDLKAAAEITQRIKDQDNPYRAQLEQIEALQRAIELVGDASKDTFDAKKLKEYEAAQDRIRRQVAGMKLESAANNIAAGLSSLQSLAKEGTQAYARMQVAIDAANIAAAIGAVMNQGMGDPYTAFARMAAMATLVATFVGDIHGSINAGFSDTAAQRQATQGAGTVLGDTTAKSESIAKATAITANATQQLVGLNRGMLTALQALQNALGAAGNSLARGAGNVDFGGVGGSTKGLLGLDLIGSALTSDPIGGAIGSFLWGGSKKITDQGIVIMGGTLVDMLKNIMVGVYQTIETDGGLFGSNSRKDRLSSVSDEFAKQFQLVIGSIIDTVRQGALALGILPADIEAAIAQFRVEEIRISLKGLSAEDQQKELEAVFSSLFDGLAGAVVPFIEKFQKVGEGLGETLVRIATEVAVAKEAFKQLGLAVHETDPEKIAQISDSLIEAAGGIEAFITGMQSFVKNFAPEGHQLAVSGDELKSALEQVGLSVPATREEMWQLMQSLDATTEAGRKQIATLLRLSSTADQYYSIVEKLTDDMVKKIEAAYETLSNFGTGVGDGGNKIRAINKSALNAVAAANLLAKAAGQQGAAEWQLALIHRIAATRAAEAVAQLISATREMVAQFNGTVPDVSSSATDASSSVRGFGDAMGEAARRASEAINLLLGDLSPLNDEAKLQIALQALQRGEVGREDVLKIGRRLYASSQAYADLFNRVMRMSVPVPSEYGAATGTTAASGPAAAQTTPEQRARERMDLAMRIGQNVATIANAQGQSFSDVADMLDLNLTDIGKAMGLSNEELNAWLENLVAQENRTPDSVREGADRIIYAMYDIAGKVPREQTGLDRRKAPVGSFHSPQHGGDQQGGAHADGIRTDGDTSTRLNIPELRRPTQRADAATRTSSTEEIAATAEFRSLLRELVAKIERNGEIKIDQDSTDAIGASVARHSDHRTPAMVNGNRRNDRAYSP